MKKIKTALISVSDKKNLKPLLNVLKKNKVKIISSGGTFKEIKKLKFNCIEVSQFTNSPEILGGRVKTLHPKIHAGILNKRDNKLHLKDLKINNFENIDLVVVNFYPFENTLKKTTNHNKIIENIDVGGPAMVRSAAKNYRDVNIITSSDQYSELIDEINKYKGSTSLDFRKKLSRIAFTETAYYDSVISEYFNKITNTYFPKKKILHGNLITALRYGENPHQIFANYPKNYSTPEINIPISDKRKFKIIEALKPIVNKNEYKLVDIDGIRLEKENCWGLIRASNTSPNLVLRFEGKSEQDLNEIKNYFKEILSKIDIQKKNFFDEYF